MLTPHFVTVVAAFLCTYLIHSTLLLAPVWWLAAKRLRPSTPELRSQLLKYSMLVPLLTTLAVTLSAGPHWGFQLPLVNHDAALSSPHQATDTQTLSTPPVQSLPSAVPMESLPHDSSPFIVQSPDAPAASVLNESSQPAATAPHTPTASTHSATQCIVAIAALLWFAISMAGLIRLAVQWSNLCRLRKTATPVRDPQLLSELKKLRSRLNIHCNVALLQSHQAKVPLAAGILSPFVVFPTDSDSSRPLSAGSEFSAMLSHELAHIARRDAIWNLLLQVICRIAFFQPFNWLVCRTIRQQMDFCADSMAADVLGERMSLVQCLYQTGERLTRNTVTAPSALVLASGMALFESTLGQRVEALLSRDQNSARPTRFTKLTVLLLTLLAAVSVSLLGPRAVVEASPSPPTSDNRNDNMNKSLASLLVLAGLSMPATADQPEPAEEKTQARSTELKTTPDELPAGIRRFNGMLVGQLAAKDPEQGTFTVQVDAVSRVWRNSQAEDPRSVVGKTVRVSGVSGKFLDVLVITRTGETVEFECKHDGDGLVFPGELLRKVAPYDPADYPVLPEDFRGFRGQVAAEILSKDPETFELILRVDRVLQTWNENSAKNAESIQGKSLMLAGFWNRRDAYHDLKVGDHIEVGMQHVANRSDHLMVIEGIKKTKSAERPANEEKVAMSRREERMERREMMEAKDPQQGFKGMLVGRLVEKDAERGTFTITVDAVPRVWENNRSANPKSLVGKNVSAEGVNGRMIDALVVSKIGDTIEFGALHEEGPRVRVGEVLRKVAPVKPGDYPIVPDGFRGFRGMVTAKVIRKGDELWELIVEVEQVHNTFDGNRAEQPQSVVGKQIMLAGFWNRKDEFHNIKVGERIRCGMNHTQVLSDHLTVIEGIRKLEGDSESE